MSMITYNLMVHLAFIAVLSVIGLPSLIISLVSKKPEVQCCLMVIGGLLTILNFMSIFIFFARTLPDYLHYIQYIK